ncbi:hypothetical protein MKEN_00046900 [Mycena kentingensis (nom. inval.)]|nr:hypothetical protein MKEN_00046900 [Mycena kentingensis (nom. inval.)]
MPPRATSPPFLSLSFRLRYHHRMLSTTNRTFRVATLFSLATLVFVALQFREETQRAFAKIPALVDKHIYSGGGGGDLAAFPAAGTAPALEEDESDDAILLASLPPVMYPSHLADYAQRQWQTPAEESYQALRSCLKTKSCPENRKKVILTFSMYWRNSLRGDVGGEEVWAMSTIHAAYNLGYTLIHVEHMEQLVRIYQYFPDMVKVVFMDDWETFNCWREDWCRQTPHNPTGIPGYKARIGVEKRVVVGLTDEIFRCFPTISGYVNRQCRNPTTLTSPQTFPRNPLGPKWIISPEPYHLQSLREPQSNNSYLGYSIEKVCRSQRFIPHSERPQQAWILAKFLTYFFPEKDFVWSKDILDAVADETGVQFAMAARHPHDPPAQEDIDRVPIYLPDQKHYVNHVHLQQDKFMAELAQSRVLIGIGNPLISPTPWNGLCLGVPFINVVTEWDESNWEDRMQWRSQHAFASLLDPPYVYNVRRGDKQGLIDAVKAALANPIDSFVPERMTFPSIEERLAPIVDRDWEALEREQKTTCSEPCGCATPCDTEIYGVHWPPA